MPGKPIEIDLRRDLPKVREKWRSLIRQRGKCLYAAPCIIGAMVPESLRAGLDQPITGTTCPNISHLIKARKVIVPEGQAADCADLQNVFDNSEPRVIRAELTRLEAKYLPASKD